MRSEKSSRGPMDLSSPFLIPFQHPPFYVLSFLDFSVAILLGTGLIRCKAVAAPCFYPWLFLHSLPLSPSLSRVYGYKCLGVEKETLKNIPTSWQNGLNRIFSSKCFPSFVIFLRTFSFLRLGVLVSKLRKKDSPMYIFIQLSGIFYYWKDFTPFASREMMDSSTVSRRRS